MITNVADHLGLDCRSDAFLRGYLEYYKMSFIGRKLTSGDSSRFLDWAKVRIEVGDLDVSEQAMALNLKKNLAGQWIVGLWGRKHFVSLEIDQRGAITVHDAQNGDDYDGAHLPNGEDDCYMRVELK
jgi:hypothetical protein